MTRSFHEVFGVQQVMMLSTFSICWSVIVNDGRVDLFICKENLIKLIFIFNCLQRFFANLNYDFVFVQRLH